MHKLQINSFGISLVLELDLTGSVLKFLDYKVFPMQNVREFPIII